MALTRKMLSAMGISEEAQEEIISAHVEVTDSLKDERDSFKAQAQKATSLEKELAALQESMKNGDKSPYKVKYEAKVEELENLQNEFDKFKKDVDEKETTSKKQSAYRQLLKNAGVSEKRIDSIVKVTDLKGLEFDGDGNLKNADKLTENIKSEWGDFIVTQTEQGAKTATPPANNGGSTRTKKDIMEIKDTQERQQAWAEYLADQKGE